MLKFFTEIKQNKSKWLHKIYVNGLLLAGVAVMLSFQNCAQPQSLKVLNKTDSASSQSLASPTDSAPTPQNIEPQNTRNFCARPLVANGTVGPAPGCFITCSEGYTQSFGTCVKYTGQSCPNPATLTNTIVGPAPGCQLSCDDNYTLSKGRCIPLGKSCNPSFVLNGTIDSSSCQITCNESFELNGSFCMPKSAPQSPPANFACGISGSLSSYNVTASIPVARADLGKIGYFFFVGEYEGEYYSYGNINGKMAWTKYDGSNAKGFQVQFSSGLTNYPFFKNADFRGYSGAKLYVGYGVGLNESEALNDSLTNKKYGDCGGALPPDPNPKPASFSCNNTGPLNSYNVTASVDVNSNDMGKMGAYFVVGLWNGKYYSYDGKGWTPYNGSNATGVPTTSLGNIKDYPIFANANFTDYTGAQLYVAYGVGSRIETDANGVSKKVPDLALALKDSLDHHKFAECGKPLPQISQIPVIQCTPTQLSNPYKMDVVIANDSSLYGQPSYLFLIGKSPTGEFYTYSPVKKWFKYNGPATAISFYGTSQSFGQTSKDFSASIPLQDYDLVDKSGFQLYIGFGTGSTEAEAVSDVINHSKFSACGGPLSFVTAPPPPVTVEPAPTASEVKCIHPTNAAANNYSLSVSIKLASKDVGQKGYYFVVGLWKGEYYSFNGTEWTKYNGSNATSYGQLQTPLQNVTDYKLFENQNFSDYIGARIYVGYGAGENLSAALKDAIDNNKADCGDLR